MKKILFFSCLLALLTCVSILHLYADPDYEVWKTAHFTSTQISNGLSAESVDFDNDGLVNLIEYAFNLDPTVPSARDTLPQITALSASNLSLEYERASTLTSQQIEFKTSPDLIHWTAADAGIDYTEQNLGVTTNGADQIEVTFAGITGDSSFVHTKVYLGAGPTSAVDHSIVINEIRYSSALFADGASLDDKGVGIVGISWEAIGWQVTSRDYIRAQLLDGLITTEWRTEAIQKDASGDFPGVTYAHIDYELPLNTTISEFKIVTGDVGRPKDYEIYVSDTYPVSSPLKYTDAFVSPTVVKSGSFPDSSGVLTLSLPAYTQGRYLRVKFLNTHDDKPIILRDSNMRFGVPPFGEYVELYNKGTHTVDLSNWRLSGEVDFAIPTGTSMAPGSYLVIASDPANPNYPQQPLGPLAGRISSSGGRINLRDANDLKVDRVDYNLGFPWPVAKGNGASIELIHPDLENDQGGNWRSSIDVAAGERYGRPTPGTQNLVYNTTAAPVLSKVNHTPQEPSSSENVVITVKAEDPDGIKSVLLHYQVVDVTGDSYIRTRDSAFSSWYNKTTAQDATDLEMLDDGQGSDLVAGDGIYTVMVPASVHDRQEIVRYRITALDHTDQQVSVPYADDKRLNFAYHCFDGVPDYTAESYAGTYAGKTYPADSLTQIPVYHFYCRKKTGIEYPPEYRSDNRQTRMWGGYEMIKGDNFMQSNGRDKQEYYGQGTMVYEGVVYDHVRFRLRGESSTYSHGYKNKWKIKFNPSQRFEARDMYGKKYKNPWRVMNILNGHARSFHERENASLTGSLGAYFSQPASFKMADLMGLHTPKSHYFHLRMNFDWKDQTHEDSGYMGPFMGSFVAIQQQDETFIDENDMPEGNIYNVKYQISVSGRRYHSDGFYSDGSDFEALRDLIAAGNIPAATVESRVDVDSYINWCIMNLAMNNTDVRPLGNVVFFHNKETEKWECLPWDLNWTFDNYFTVGLLGSGATVLDWDEFNSLFTIPTYKLAFNNRARELISLLYENGDTDVLLDSYQYCFDHGRQTPMSEADRAVWDFNPLTKHTSGYMNRGSYFNFKGNGQTLVSMLDTIKNFAKRGYYGGNQLDDYPYRDDSGIPTQPTISYTGTASYPTDGLSFSCGNFNGSGFGAMKWRIAEITNPNAPDFDLSAKPNYEINADWESGELTQFNNHISIPANSLKENRTYRARVCMKDSAGRWSYWSDPVQFYTSIPAVRVYVNEIMAHTDDPHRDAIEIYNPTTRSIDLGGWMLSDDKGTNNTWAIPANTTLPANGYKVFYEGGGYSAGVLQIDSAIHFGNTFSLRALGDGAYITAPDGSYQHGFKFDGTYNATTIGRYINSVGKEVDTELVSPSLGSVNGGPLTGDIVLSEIMYHPENNDPDPSLRDHEYIEIVNRTGSSIPLHNTNGDSWKIAGIGFDFPANTVMQPNEVMVFVADTITPDDFRLKYGIPSAVRVFGYDGNLNNGSETIKLMAPDEPVLSGNNIGQVGYVIIDKVDYNDDLPWPVEADGAGSSLQRKVLASFGNDAGNWQASTLRGGTPGTIAAITTPVIAMSESTLFGVVTEGKNASIDTFSAWNAGVNTLNYSILENSPLIHSISPTTGSSTGPNDRNTHTIRFNTSSLAAGQYTGVITVSATGLASATLQVSITVQPDLTPFNLPLTAEVGDSSNGTGGTSLPNTLSDSFSYDPEHPTENLPNQVYSTSRAYAVNLPAGTDAKLVYTINDGAVTLTGGRTLFVDIYGRNILNNRSQDIDIELYNGGPNGSLIDRVAGLGTAMTTPFHVRAALSPVAAFDTIVVIGHDSTVNDNNKFCIMEIRAAK